MMRIKHLFSVSTWGFRLVLGLALALVVGLGLVYLVGQQTERGFEQAQARLRAEHPRLDLRPQSYQRGWLSAETGTHLALPGLDSALQLRHRIQHTLLFRPTRMQTWVGLDGDAQPLAQVETEVGLDGAGRSQLRWPTRQRQDWAWEGGEGELHFEPGGRLRADLELPALRADLAGVEWQLSQANLEWRQDPGGQGIDLGQGQLRLGSFSSQRPGQALLHCADATLDLKLYRQNALETLELNLRCANLALLGEAHGELELGLALRNLDPTVVAGMLTTLRSLLRQQPNPRLRTMVLSWLLLQYAQDLFKTSPSLEISRFRLGQHAQATLRLSAERPASGMVFNPSAWLRQLSAQLDLSVSLRLLRQLSRLELAWTGAPSDPESAAARLSPRLQDWLRQGWLSPQEDGYRSRLDFEAGRLRLNGREFDL